MSQKNSVVLVNDDSDVLNLFKDALEHEHIQSYAFIDPKLALEKIKANPELFSLVLVNYSCSISKSHRAFAKHVKEIRNEIKVILTSGYDLSNECLSKDEYDDYLKLPVRMADLVLKVKEALGTGFLN